MDSFDKFRNGINQKSKNTRSSLIESQLTRSDDNNTTCDLCRRKAESIDSDVNANFELVTEQRRIVNPFKTYTQSEQQGIAEEPSVQQYFQRKPFNEIYNSSGKPFNLSNFRNHMNSEIELMPYDESGRTFNLTENLENNSNNLQNPVYKNDNSSVHLSKSKQQRRTHNLDGSRISFHHVPSEFLKTSCSNFFQTSQFQYDQNDKMKSALPLQPLVTQRNPLFETLVMDHQDKIIVDSVNGLINFNKLAFDAVFDCGYIPLEIDKESVPMSLLEAFYLRIQYEQDLRDDLEKRNFFCSNAFQNAQKETTSVANKDDKGSEKPTYWTHRDEIKLASTIDIDLMTKMTNFPETPLTQAINCLLRAEKMNNFDRNVHLAEEAIRTAPDGQQELAALKSTCSFKLDLRKDETKTNTYEPLAIISYIGTMKPNN